MTNNSGHDSKTGADTGSGFQVPSFKEELKTMPPLMRWMVYTSVFCLGLLCLQSVTIMPIILYKYGWGIGGGFIH